ncbi:MAG: hypothetical protein AB1806_10000 [Acidobacteriota bacterium]
MRKKTGLRFWLMGYLAALLLACYATPVAAWCPYYCDADPCPGEEYCGYGAVLYGTYYGGWGSCGWPYWCDFGDCYSLYMGAFGCNMACWEDWGYVEECSPVPVI